MNNDRQVEISLVYKDDDEFKIEKVFAEKIGSYYQIKAVPAFANNLAYYDIVAIEYENGEFFFDKLIKPSGHSVVHLVILEASFSTNILASLATFGVGINYLGNNLYLVLDIPPQVNYNDLKKFLDLQQESGRLDYKEACISLQHQE